MGIDYTCELIQQLNEYNQKNIIQDHENNIKNLEKKIVYEISKVNFSENLQAMIVFNQIRESDIINFIKSETTKFEDEIKKYDPNYNNWKYIDEKDLMNIDNNLISNIPFILENKVISPDPLIPFLNSLRPIITTKIEHQNINTVKYGLFDIDQQIDNLFSSFRS